MSIIDIYIFGISHFVGRRKFLTRLRCGKYWLNIHFSPTATNDSLRDDYSKAIRVGLAENHGAAQARARISHCTPN